MLRKFSIIVTLVWGAAFFSVPDIRAFYESPPIRTGTGRQSNLLKVHRMQSSVILDGKSSEPAWAHITPHSFVQHSPNYGLESSEQTQVLFGFDDEYFYIAGRLYDKEPEKIQASTKKRDTMSPSNDWFGVLIDTFNDKENGLAFFTTPVGLRFDAAVYNDGQPTDMSTGMPPLNLSWNTFWDVETTRNQEGWFVEMRIPLSSLRFQIEDGQVVVGIIAWRYVPRHNEMSIFPAIPPDWGPWSLWKPSQAQEFEMQGVSSRKPLLIIPYVLGGYGRTFELNEAGTDYLGEKDPVAEAGLDLKYGLTSNLTLDLTLNTDFAQVEADDQQVNLTRFSLFFPEKRLFFQERSSTFEFNFGGPNSLFYSRRIGINEDEDEIVPIYGGARLVGRLGDWDIGVLTLQTAAVDTLPSENFGVFRLRRQVFNSNSYVGGMVTSRIGTDGSYNVAYGLDSIIRMFGQDYFTLNWAQTFQDNHSHRFLSLDPSKLRLSWDRRTVKGAAYSFSYSRAGKEYDPGLGFEMRENYTRFGNRILYGWIPGEDSFLNWHQIFLGGSLTLSNRDQSVESAEIGPGWTGETKSGFGGSFQPKYFEESLTENFEISDEVEVPVGRYKFFGAEGTFNTPMGRMLSLMGTFQAGGFYDGWRMSLGFLPRWSINSTWELEGYYQYNRVVFQDRSQDLTAHLARLKILATLSIKFTASAFLQYNEFSHAVIANVRFRYNPREGNDLYLVYNEVLNTARMRESPALPPSDSRAIMLKYTYTFNVK